MLGVQMAFAIERRHQMGDKSPKSKQRGKDQKTAAKTQTKNDQAKRQAGYASPPKDKKK